MTFNPKTMNDPTNCRNILIVKSNNNISISLFKIALRLASKGLTVFYIVSKPLLALPGGLDPSEVTSKDNPCLPDVLKQIIFMDCSSADVLIEKLLDLHNCCNIPSLIIIDALHQFFTHHILLNAEPHNVVLPSEPEFGRFAQKNAVILASLQSCVNAFSQKLGAKVFSITSIDTSCNLYQSFLPTILDLYYYSGNFIHSIEENVFENIFSISE